MLFSMIHAGYEDDDHCRKKITSPANAGTRRQLEECRGYPIYPVYILYMKTTREIMWRSRVVRKPLARENERNGKPQEISYEGRDSFMLRLIRPSVEN